MSKIYPKLIYPSLENLPEGVWKAMCIINSGMTGMEGYNHCEAMIEQHPGCFPWETRYSEIPQEVHDNYYKEVNNTDKTEMEVKSEMLERFKNEPPIQCTGSFWETMPRKVVEVNLSPTQEELNKQIQDFFDECNRQTQEKYDKERRELKLWHKHYKKYSLPPRARLWD